MTVGDWEDAMAGCLLMMLTTEDVEQKASVRLALAFNRTRGEQPLSLPPSRGTGWMPVTGPSDAPLSALAPRSVEFFVETH